MSWKFKWSWTTTKFKVASGRKKTIYNYSSFHWDESLPYRIYDDFYNIDILVLIKFEGTFEDCWQYWMYIVIPMLWWNKT